jgi:hypothetical protein
MTELHAGLKLFRDELRDAVARDLASPRRSRARARGALVPVLAAAAAAGVLVITQTGAPAVPAVDAAIMRHVTAALTPPPATILHERARVTRGSTTQPYELWTETGPPFHYRVIKWGHEGAGVGSEPTDPAAALRSLVASGKAHVAASTTIAGVAAYKLTVAGAPRFLNGTAYVSRADYRPLEIDTTDGGGERIVFQSYEHLPANSSNLALLK